LNIGSAAPRKIQGCSSKRSRAEPGVGKLFSTSIVNFTAVDPRLSAGAVAAAVAVAQ
jgi:hypothetical protein